MYCSILMLRELGNIRNLGKKHKERSILVMQAVNVCVRIIHIVTYVLFLLSKSNIQ